MSQNRRKFLKTLLQGAGAGLAGHLTMPLAAAVDTFIPWQQVVGAEGGEGTGLSLGSIFTPRPGTRHLAPALSASGAGRIAMAWVGQIEDTPESPEGLHAAWLRADGEPEIVTVATGSVHYPCVVSDGDACVVAWTSYESPGVWRVRAARLEGSEVVSEWSVSEAGRTALRPAIARDSSGRISVAYQEKREGKFVVCVRPLEERGLGDVWSPAGAGAGDQFRPALCAAPDGLWVAYDEAHAAGTHRVYLVRAGSSDAPRAVSHDCGYHIAPALAADPAGGLWIAWQSNYWSNHGWDVPRWFQLRRFLRGRLSEPSEFPPGKNRDDNGQVQGFESVQLCALGRGRICITGRASQNFYVQEFSLNDGWGKLYRLPRDGWGGRGIRLAAVAKGDGSLSTARRDIERLVVQDLTLEPPRGTTRQNIRDVKSSPEGPIVLVPAAPSKPRFEPWNGLNYYFGDLHGHTAHSDGTGDIDEYYLARRDLYGLDFASLTDHDTFVGRSILPSEWEEMKELTTHYDEAGRFAAIIGQEWTTFRVPRGFGHICLYSTRRDMPLFDHVSEDYENQVRMLEALKQYDGIAIPHHTGWTGFVWEDFREDVIPAFEICSVHGACEYEGNEPISHRGNHRGSFIQDGWKRGLKYGVIGGTDCHGLIWHHGMCWKRDPFRAGWAGVLAEELTPAAILDAIRKRRTYATTGIWARVEFSVNGAPMGEVIQAAAGSPVALEVVVSSESRIKWVDFVRNNETIFRYGAEGNDTKVTFRDAEPPGEGTNWYYARVTCRDDNMVWTSPVWVEPGAAAAPAPEAT